MNSKPAKQAYPQVRTLSSLSRVRNGHKFMRQGKLRNVKPSVRRVYISHSDLSLCCPDTLLFHILAYSTCFHTDFVSVGITGFYSYVERKIIVACRLQVVRSRLHSRPNWGTTSFPKRELFSALQTVSPFIFIPFNPKLWRLASLIVLLTSALAGLRIRWHALFSEMRKPFHFF